MFMLIMLLWFCGCPRRNEHRRRLPNRDRWTKHRRQRNLRLLPLCRWSYCATERRALSSWEEPPGLFEPMVGKKRARVRIVVLVVADGLEG